jgi:hypothetical protein
MDFIYASTPVDTAKIKAIPIIPIDPAKDVKNVLPFLVIKLLKESDIAVQKDIDAFFFFFTVSRFS